MSPTFLLLGPASTPDDARTNSHHLAVRAATTSSPCSSQSCRGSFTVTVAAVTSLRGLTSCHEPGQLVEGQDAAVRWCSPNIPFARRERRTRPVDAGVGPDSTRSRSMCAFSATDEPPPRYDDHPFRSPLPRRSRAARLIAPPWGSERCLRYQHPADRGFGARGGLGFAHCVVLGTRRRARGSPPTAASAGPPPHTHTHTWRRASPRGGWSQSARRVAGGPAGLTADTLRGAQTQPSVVHISFAVTDVRLMSPWALVCRSRFSVCAPGVRGRQRARATAPRT